MPDPQPDLTKAETPPPGLSSGVSRDPSGGLLLAGQPPATMFPGGVPGGKSGGATEHGPGPFDNGAYHLPADLKDPIREPQPTSAAEGLAYFVKRNMELEGRGKDPRSSAVSGFIDSTWLSVTRGEPKTQGLSQDQILALRNDNSAAGEQFRAQMTAKLAAQNGHSLAGAGIPVNNGTLRLADWFGAGGAINIAKADPNTPIDKVVGDKVVSANPEIRGLTTAQVMAKTARQMDGSGNNPFAIRGGLSEAAEHLATEQRASTDKEIASLESQRQSILAEAQAAAPGTAKRMEMLDKANERAARLTDLYEQKSREAPTKQPTDIFAGFGGIVMALAAFAGGKSRQPLTASLNAMSGAVDAMNEGNEKDFQNRMKIWEKQTDYALKAVELQNANIRNILEDQRLSDAEKQARLTTEFHAADMTHWVAQLRSGDMKDIWGYMQASERTATEARREAEHIREFNANYEQHERLAAGRTPEERYVEGKVEELGPNATLPEKNARRLEAEKEFKQATGAGHSGTMAGLKAQTAQQMIGEAEAKMGRPLSGEEKAGLISFVEKGGVTGNERQKLEARVDLYDDSLDKINAALGTLQTHTGAAGIPGYATRIAERVSDLFGSNETDRVQFLRDIEYLRMMGTRLLTDASGRPLSSEAKRIDSVIGGINMGDTTANTIRSLEEIKAMYKKSREDTMLQVKGVWTPRDERGPTAAAPTGAAPSSSDPSQPWLDAPAVR